MKKETLIIDGNAFYEIDIDCMEKKKVSQKPPDSRTKTREIQSHPVKRQRN